MAAAFRNPPLGRQAYPEAVWQPLHFRVSGYEAVAADRQGVTDLFTNPKVRSIIQKKGIQLISYADLVKKP
jgi:hypothetical protein